MDEHRLTPGDFVAFFKDVHGHEPFPWQRRLTVRVLCREEWPKVIDLPTGTGKTAVLDTAVFAMATRPAVFPRRVVFVVDRRIVVDQVYERAWRIKERVEEGKTPVLRRVRERLRALSDGESLGVAMLRGGVPMDEWPDSPDQPWVMVSTVDQFGSRLLFRGYGVRRRMRPIHAGLAGNDCLAILDEVHLSVPFAETLSQVAALKSEKLPCRFDIVEMSATPGNADVERFELKQSDLDECEELCRRVSAAKQAKLVTVKDREALPAEIVRIVDSVAKSKTGGDIRSIGVVVNRVQTARETRRALEEGGHDAVHLVTGRMRPLDRGAVLDRIGPAVNPDIEKHPGETVIVVATQAIEVGADFSFDALVTECAPVDSLRQRFGRLDRRGIRHDRTDAPAQAWILGPKPSLSSTKPDPIYGHSIKATWKELERRAVDGRIDIGLRSLRDFPEGASAPRDRAPLLLKTHMDAWVQTNPEPIVQPLLEWFLHGIDRHRTAEVSILWRWDRSPDALRLVPPRQAEFLQVPLDAAKSWLAGDPEPDVADVVRAGATGGDSAVTGNGSSTGCVRWVGFDEDPKPVSADDIGPGDVLIMDPDRGGLRAGTWDPSSDEQVADLGDEAQIIYGRKATLRLDPRLLDATPPAVPGDETEVDIPARERILRWLGEHRDASSDQPQWFSEAVKRLNGNPEIVSVGFGGESEVSGYYILSERQPGTEKPRVDTAVMDGSDESGSMTGTGVTLRHHLDGVGERAGRTAGRLGLSAKLVEDLRLAGRLHDLGKVDQRFQAQLVGDDPVALAILDEPLAKSRPGARRVRRYPRGMRHEVASVAMIDSNPAVLTDAHDRDLVLYLVGTHHGLGRPLPPVIEDPKPQTLAYTFDGHAMEANSDLTEGSLALDMADRFWRLVERYGYHGLAWLEAILRLADHRQSAEEATRP